MAADRVYMFMQLHAGIQGFAGFRPHDVPTSLMMFASLQMDSNIHRIELVGCWRCCCYPGTNALCYSGRRNALSTVPKVTARLSCGRALHCT